MKYYLQEIIDTTATQRNAGSKARQDINSLLEDMGYIPLASILKKPIKTSLLNKITIQFEKYNELQNLLVQLREGDELVFQFPIFKQTILLKKLFRSLQKRKVKVVVVIHDLETIRKLMMTNLSFFEKLQIKHSELDLLKLSNKIISHNKEMTKKLVEHGIDGEKITNLDIFDYLLPETIQLPAVQYSEPIIIAGNLDPLKVGYLNNLPTDINFNLYGVGFDTTIASDTINYKGSFLPDELPTYLDGSFGLVWDGDRADTCSGVFGNYLKYNNSHKASLYLASGLPLIVWKDSALANFVLKNQCGIVVESLFDIKASLDRMDSYRYDELRRNASKIGKDIRAGRYFKTAMASH
ncbi:galactofuranosyltransferase [Streptococcus hyovaginalis]